MGFVRRQAVVAALTANAIRPLPGFRTGIAAFFAGWLTGELAPHVLTGTAVDVATHLTSHRRDPRGLALAAASSAGLLYLIRQSRQVQQVAEDALEEGLGLDYVEQLDAAPTPAELATPWRQLINPFRTRDRDLVRVERDIAYADHGRRGLLDVYLPRQGTVEKAPVLLQIHGGAWSFGSKNEQGVPLMRHLAARGWVCVAINYRLAPRDAWPAQIVDVKAAIAWIRSHIADYGGDPSYLAITGGSAGGHLCALAALSPNDPEFQPGFEDADTRVQVAVPHYGVYDLTGLTGVRNTIKMRDEFLAPRIFQRRFTDDPGLFERASPLARVDGVDPDDIPDLFVLHGTRDTLVPLPGARALVERLRARSRRAVVYAELPGAQHAFDIFPSIRSAHIVRSVDRFLHWHWNGWRRAQAG